MVRAHIRRNSAASPPLALGPLPPTPAPSATTPVSPTEREREPTPFDELPMSHLISFPMMDSPTSGDSVDSNPFEAFHTLQHSYSSSYPSSSSLLRDAFDYYRLPPNNPPPVHDALNMSLHGTALKPQLHAHTLPDLTNALAYPAPIQQQPQQCIPTAHLFSAAQAVQAAQAASPVKPSPSPVEDDGSPTPQSSSSQSQPSKKRPPRAAISTKDFIPPDVSGLSKREARLVKNRAAAFLSRQRKREEFETMEVRVAQLEQENARLLALTKSQSQSRSSSPDPSPHPAKSEPSDSPADDTELISLRSLLSQSRTRTVELEAELARLRPSSASSSEASSDVGSPGAPVQVKRESGPEVLPKRAGLFGVVLLCALPTLLSLPAPAVPYAASRFSFTPGPGAHQQHTHAQAESLLDWTGMEVDDSDMTSSTAAERDARRKVHLPLSFLNGQANAHGLGDLFQGSSNGLGYGLSPSSEPELSSPFVDGQTEAEFDISFVPSSTSGKVRVRIESPSSSEMPPVPSLTREGSSPPSSLGSGSPALAFSTTTTTTTSSSSGREGWDLDFATSDRSHEMIWDSPSAGANVDVSLFAASSQAASAGRRRVRIALKNGPVVGAEGGEWEVEVR